MLLSLLRVLKSGFVLLLSVSILLGVFSVQAQDGTPPDPLLTQEVEAEPLSTEPVEPVEPLPAATVEPTLPAPSNTPFPTSTYWASSTPGPTHTPNLNNPTNTPQPTSTQILSYAFYTNFQDTAWYNLVLDPFWTWIDVAGGKALQSSPSSDAFGHYYEAQFNEGRVEALFEVNQGVGGLLWGGYSVQLRADKSLELFDGATSLGTASVSDVTGPLIFLELEVIPGSIRVAAQGVTRITAIPTMPMQAVNPAFWSGNNSVIRVDNFGISGTPTVTNTPVPTATPTLYGPPAAPSNLQIRVIGTGSGEIFTTATSTTTPATSTNTPFYPTASPDQFPITLLISWEDNSWDESHFFIERTFNSGTFTLTAYADSVAMTDSMPCLTTIAYRVRSARQFDYAVSDWTPWVSITTPPCGATATPTMTPVTITPTPTLTPVYALEAPVPLSPAFGGVVTRAPWLTWAAVEGATSYDVQIDDASDFASPLGSVTTTDTGRGFDNADNQGLYWWRVRARNTQGDVSGWSSPFNVTVNHAISPANNSIVVTTLPASVTFRWADLQNSIVSYRVEVDDDPSFGSIDYQSPVTSQAMTTLSNLPAGVYSWRVRVVGAGVIPFVGTDSVSNFFTITTALTRAPQLLSPTNNAFLQPNQRPTVPLTWGWGTAGEPAGGPFTYDVEIDDVSASFNSVNILSMSGLSEMAATANLPSGTYFWHVRAVNPFGLPGPWSSTFRFVVNFEPPPAPRVLTPANAAGLTTGRPSFSWTSVSEAVSYTLEISVSCGNTPTYSISNLTTTSHTIPASASPLPQGWYQVCVRAINASGNSSSYGLGSNSFDEGQPFYISLATAPANGAFITTATKPTFTWVALPGLAGETVGYRVLIYNGNNLVHESPILSGTSYTLPTTLPEETYSWQLIRSVNGVDDAPPPRTLFVGALTAGPTILLPSANALVGQNVDLFWERATPPAGVEILAYQLQVSRSANFSTLVYDAAVSSENFPQNLPIGTTYSPDANQNRVTNYWRVRGLWNGLPVTNWSTRSFIADTVAPAAPVINSPANNALVGTLRPTITWNAVSGATYYDVQINDPISGQTLLQQFVNGTSFTPSINLPQTPLTVFVFAHDGVNVSTEAIVSLTPRLGSTPAQNATLSALRPTFTWVPVVGATGYTLQIDDDLFFDQPDSAGDTTVMQQIALGAVTSHTLATDLPGTGVYYWRLKPSNGDYPTPYGSRVFYVASSNSLKPTGLYAAMDAPENPPQTVFNSATANIAFVWTPVAITPSRYQLMVSSSSGFPNEGTFYSYPPEANTLIDQGELTEGVKYWRVRAIYSVDDTSYGPWSDVKSFTLDRVAPLPPMLISPADSVTISAARPTFTWASTVGSTGYFLEVLDGASLTPLPGLNFLPVTGTSYTLPNTQPGLYQSNTSGYLFTVYARDAAGNMSPGSMTRSFYVFSGLNPSKNQVLNDTTPAFTWSAVTGVGAAPWRLEIARDSSMIDMVYTSPVLPANASSFTLPNANPLPQGLYYWRVTRTGEETGLIVGQAFYIGTASGLTPTPLTPAANGWINGLDMSFGIEFSWAAPTSFTPDHYILEVASNSSFDAGAILYAAQMSSDFWTANDLSLGEGTYYWRVRGIMGAFTAPASAPRSMRVDLTPTAQPVLIAPAVADVLTTNTPTFRWQSVSGAAQYLLEVGNDEFFVTPLYTVTLSSGTTQHKLPAAATLTNGTYWWRLSALDPAKNRATTGRLFTVAAP